MRPLDLSVPILANCIQGFTQQHYASGFRNTGTDIFMIHNCMLDAGQTQGRPAHWAQPTGPKASTKKRKVSDHAWFQEIMLPISVVAKI